MAKTQKKITKDQSSIPVRVTNAKQAVLKSENSDQGADESRAKDRPTKSDHDELEKLLMQDGKKQDMTKFVKTNSKKRLIIRIIIILLVLFGVAFAGFLYFSRDTKQFGKNITFAIDTPANGASGEVLTLNVRYQNNESIALTDVEVSMQFPEGFLFQSSIPSSTTTNSWTIGDLDANAGGVIEMRGQLVGDVGSVKTFSGTLTYKSSNFNYSFTEEATTTVTITSSTLDVSIDAPLRAVPGKEFEVSVKYKNTSEKAIDTMQVVLASPEGFTMNSAEPEADKSVWKIEDVAADSEGTVKFKGTLSGNEGDQKQFTVKVGFLDSQGNMQLQAEKSFLILLIKAGLSLEVKATPPQAGFAQWGDTITYAVTYTNNGDVQLSNVTVKLSLDDETNGGTDVTIIDWDSITTIGSGIVQEKSIVWNESAVEALKLLKPNDTGTFEVKIPLVKDPTIASDTDEQFHILAQVDATQTSTDTNVNDQLTTKSEVVETKIATNVALSAEARFYDDAGEQIGSGPLPPQVGEETTYVIRWFIANTSNDIEDVKVVGKLPSGVGWDGETTISAGNPLTFDPQTREVTWTINRVPAGAGTVFPRLEAKFSVSITPTQSQEGTFAVLVNASALTSNDSFVDTSRTSSAELLTTDLTNDTKARGQGLVQAAPTNTNN